MSELHTCIIMLLRFYHEDNLHLNEKEQKRIFKTICNGIQSTVKMKTIINYQGSDIFYIQDYVTD